METNIILNTDSYKYSHAPQYPKGTQYVHSYVESRGGDYDKSLFFGLQAFVKKYLLTPITQRDIDEAEALITAHGEPFNRAGWDRILKVHKGFIPVKIRSVAEGVLVPVKNVLLTVENTDPELPWTTSFIETALLRAVWYPTTVATVSYRIKQIIKQYLEETGDPTLLPFKLHDFGARGVSSEESASLGGMGHLVNFMGTDTVSALVAARRYYKADVAGFSIPAAEHSTMTSWGQENEAKAYENMIDTYAGPGKLYAVVSDSYDIINAVRNIWGKQLKDKVINSGGTLVVRPDSGDPVRVVHEVIEALADAFGYTVNDKGFKVLHPSVRVIQGDGINESMINAILMSLKYHRWSADNVAFGMGGALLQHMNRDTMKWAMKCSAIFVDGAWRDVFKNPVSDTSKASKRGRNELYKNGGFVTLPINTGWQDKLVNVMRTVYEDGKLLIDESLDTIRERSNALH